MSIREKGPRYENPGLNADPALLDMDPVTQAHLESLIR